MMTCMDHLGRRRGRNFTRKAWKVLPEESTKGNAETGKQWTSLSGRRGSSVSAEFSHVMKFPIISSLYGKAPQSIFSLSQASINYALTHDYGRNSSDDLTICVKFGKTAPKY